MTGDGRRAVDLQGVGPTGDPLALRVVGVQHDSLLVFLSSGCSTCTSFWHDIAAQPPLDGIRVIVVTRGADEESPSAVRELAGPDLTVVLSTAAWRELEIPGSPYVVHVDGPTGHVVGEGTAGSWAQVLDLFLRAGADGSGGDRKAAADRRRERELDRLLLSAGVAPGDDSLYGHQQAGSARDPVDGDGAAGRREV